MFKNFAPLDEDFFARFLFFNVGIMTGTFGLTFLYIPGKLNINHYICIGEDPAKDPYPFKKVITDRLAVARAIYVSAHQLKLFFFSTQSTPFCPPFLWCFTWLCQLEFGGSKRSFSGTSIIQSIFQSIQKFKILLQ